MLALAVLVIDTDLFYMEKMADEFVMDVRYVQMECMKKTTATYSISIDINNKCYHVFNNAVIEKTVKFKDRYQIDYSNKNMDYVGFTHEGIPINAGTFKILNTKNNKYKEISIVPATGRTVIKE